MKDPPFPAALHLVAAAAVTRFAVQHTPHLPHSTVRALIIQGEGVRHVCTSVVSMKLMWEIKRVKTVAIDLPTSTDST
ncbi:hypothetical protein E2C01_039678 [Portunus trituberculatus]|uniref:Uncharacterized protein n=1 Tax=Portunus trituberculatus TaxID=210409 RepID=A0A5B7FHN3_PORTR|nr:hypothetical protein [Portunus trituberculatus]